MKYLLTIILFMSVNVFADFNITTLDCELQLADPYSTFDKSSIVRVDEKRKELRVNLFPVSPYISNYDDSLYEIGFVFDKTSYKIKLTVGDLILYIERKKENEEEFKGAFYKCKII